MALNLSKEERIAYENMLKTTEPYPDDDPVFNTLDGCLLYTSRMRLFCDTKIALQGVLKNFGVWCVCFFCNGVKPRWNSQRLFYGFSVISGLCINKRSEGVCRNLDGSDVGRRWKSFSLLQ